MTTNTMHAPLVKEVSIRATTAQVWKALTDSNDMRQWYFNIADFKAEVGFEVEFISDCDGANFHHLCRVTEVVPGKKLSYSWQYKDTPGDSLVTFELFEEAGHTRLRLTHTGLETFPQDLPAFTTESFTGGWNEIIGHDLPAFLQQQTS